MGNDKNINTFRERFRNARNARFRSAQALADALGEPRSNVQAWESTRNVAPPLAKLAAICRALDVSADYLLGLTDTPRPAVAQTVNGNGNAQSIGGNATAAPPCRECETVRRLLGIIEAMQRQGGRE